MTLNKTKIEWCDVSWNPVSGCYHACPYCYARAMANRFRGGDFHPKFHPERLDDPINTTKSFNIFLGSNTDMFGDWVYSELIEIVLHVCRETPQHRYLCLTKNPERYHEFDLPENFWAGTTLDAGAKSSKAPLILDRIRGLSTLNHPNKFVSIEPLYPGWVGPYLQALPAIRNLGWVIIGVQTPARPKLTPDRIEIADLYYERSLPPLFVKNSIKKIYPEFSRQEYPWDKPTKCICHPTDEDEAEARAMEPNWDDPQYHPFDDDEPPADYFDVDVGL